MDVPAAASADRDVCPSGALPLPGALRPVRSHARGRVDASRRSEPAPRIIRIMNSTVSELIELLSLERLEDDLFRGQSRDIGTRYVFGGQVLGQALSAAQATMPEPRPAHSLHAYFLRAGNVEHPIVYHVD